MLASFRAEILKLRKRPATWVLGIVWVTVVMLFGYVLTYSFVANAPPPPDDIPQEAQAQQEDFNQSQIEALLPESLLQNMFGGGFFGIGAAIVLILGALVAGSEYGWGTMKTILSQRPGKLAVLLGKLLALSVVLLLFVVLGLCGAALASFVVAGFEDAAVEWPAVGELLRGLGAGMLVFAVWALMGFALATVFRGTALAIGLGLAWALIIENTVAALPIESDTFESLRKATLSENTFGVTSYFGSTMPEGFGIPQALVDAERGVIGLLVYVAVFVLISALFMRRDVV